MRNEELKPPDRPDSARGSRYSCCLFPFPFNTISRPRKHEYYTKPRLPLRL